MAYLRLNEDKISESELKFGVRLSNFERWAVQSLGVENAEVICRYELFKLRLSAEEKANKLRNKMNKVEKNSREFYSLEEELNFLGRQINAIIEKIEIKLNRSRHLFSF